MRWLKWRCLQAVALVLWWWLLALVVVLPEGSRFAERALNRARGRQRHAQVLVMTARLQVLILAKRRKGTRHG